jgi:predicted CXXCH cytochrome family protein
MSNMKYFIILLIIALPFSAYSKTGISVTKHNLSVTGPGEIKATLETRICVFCHTPHNATPLTPLWNRSLPPANYILYASSTLRAPQRQPDGPTRLCLSCHDGTIALGNVLRPVGGIAMSSMITPDRPSYIGINLNKNHPVAFSYSSSLPNPELYSTPPPGLKFYGTDDMHCTTCHDPHDNTYGKFLVMDNRYSALCTKCHIMNGWTASTHSSSTSQIISVLPIAPRNWPTWATVAEWACEGCHASHTAGGAQRLLYYQNEESNCYPCHSGNVAQKNIYAQFQKPSRHPVEATTGVHDPKESIIIMSRHVECVDCHNPHASNNVRTGVAPAASGRLSLVSGVSIAGAVLTTVSYEYEVCLKCHSNTAIGVPFVPRVINVIDKRLQFSTVNTSYHPIAGIGKNFNIPSFPSVDPQAPTNLTASSFIYCTDCHSDDGVSNGPHGSSYAPLLKRRYETSFGTIESYDSYSLCYRCHNRNSILANQSFKKHQSHVVNDQSPCSACHDSHGVIPDSGLTGSHTHLINFDTRVALPVTGQTYPLYRDNGNGTGSCTLVCHGYTHNSSSY